MNNNDNSNKYILTKVQIDVIKKVYRQLILDGLSDVGLDMKIEKEIIDNSNKNLDMIIEDAQKILTEEGVLNEIRLEMLEDIKNEKKAAPKKKVIKKAKTKKK